MSDSQDRKMDFYGQSVSIVGKDIEIGEQAPEFIAQTTDWTMINVLNSTRGKTRIIGSLPSLNTPVCDKEIRRFMAYLVHGFWLCDFPSGLYVSHFFLIIVQSRASEKGLWSHIWQF